MKKTIVIDDAIVDKIVNKLEEALAPKKDTYLMTEEDLSKYLQVAKPTLRTWRARGGGPAFKKVGGSVRYLKKDVDTYVETHK